MSDYPKSEEDLKHFSGQHLAMDSPMFELLPAHDVLVVAGNTHPEDDGPLACDCQICKKRVSLDPRDYPELKGLKVCVVCPECFFSMEPRPAE